MSSASDLQASNKIDLNSSRSTIADTDIAKEAATLAHNQILQQISASLFTQAHQITNGLALRLLGI